MPLDAHWMKAMLTSRFTIDDYVEMDKDGKIIAYLNGGPDPGSFLGWSWKQLNKGDPITLGVGARRDQIRLANIYGHGRADYLVIDDESGAVNAWENGGPDVSSVGGWIWTPRGTFPISPATRICEY